MTNIEHRSASIESPTTPVSAENFLAFFGVQQANLPRVTIANALTVPAVLAAVAFLSRTLAALPKHAFRKSKDGPQRITGKLEIVVHEAPNEDMGAFAFWQFFWQQVFTGGRGLAWIERTPQGVEALWPMDPSRVVIKRSGMRRVYQFGNKEYAAADVIDVPFMLKPDLLNHYGPIMLAGKAIQLSLAMNDYGSQFFAGGGVPPLALTGPLPAGGEAMKRTQQDIKRAIDAAKNKGEPVFPIPPGYELKPVGLDPSKAQMVDARRFQVVEIARVYQMPPVFLQDLSSGTFNNVEQQDLHLVKHLIGQWSQALEDEMNLKLFGRMRNGRYVEHNLDGLQRGDFKSRIEGLARAIQTSQITPNEARAVENRPDHENPAANELLVQGATVVLGSAVTAAAPGAKDGLPPNDGQQQDGATP